LGNNCIFIVLNILTIYIYITSIISIYLYLYLHSTFVSMYMYASIVAGGLRQRLRGHQSFREASLLSKPEVTQGTHVQRLSPENKGSFPYIPFTAGYRNGGGVRLVPYIVTCHFIICSDLWVKVTFLWSPGTIRQLQFFFVSL
jgi:hypothetical protein